MQSVQLKHLLLNRGSISRQYSAKIVPNQGKVGKLPHADSFVWPHAKCFTTYCTMHSRTVQCTCTVQTSSWVHYVSAAVRFAGGTNDNQRTPDNAMIIVDNNDHLHDYCSQAPSRKALGACQVNCVVHVAGSCVDLHRPQRKRSRFRSCGEKPCFLNIRQSRAPDRYGAPWQACAYIRRALV